MSRKMDRVNNNNGKPGTRRWRIAREKGVEGEEGVWDCKRDVR